MPSWRNGYTARRNFRWPNCWPGKACSSRPKHPSGRSGWVTETHSVNIRTVLRGGLAEAAGMAPGDEWLGIEVNGQGWRISKLDDVVFYAGANTAVTALVARDGRLLRLPLQLSSPHRAERRAKPSRGASPTAPVPDTISLSITDPAAVARWLN
jgi:hypothetical protein